MIIIIIIYKMLLLLFIGTNTTLCKLWVLD